MYYFFERGACVFGATQPVIGGEAGTGGDPGQDNRGETNADEHDTCFAYIMRCEDGADHFLPYLRTLNSEGARSADDFSLPEREVERRQSDILGYARHVRNRVHADILETER